MHTEYSTVCVQIFLSSNKTAHIIIITIFIERRNSSKLESRGAGVARWGTWLTRKGRGKF